MCSKKERPTGVGLSDVTSARGGRAESRDEVIRESLLLVFGGGLFTFSGGLLTFGGGLFTFGGGLLTFGGGLLTFGGGLLTFGGGLFTFGGRLFTFGGGLLTFSGRLLTFWLGLRVFGGLHKDPTRRKSKDQQDNQETTFPHRFLLVCVI